MNAIRAYYNEIDRNAAAWLRELMKAGVITDGEVDERSIEDVVPAELAEFDRCHFFAGIGVWDYALTRSGWPDDRRVWTGSCPCQPFSAAGKGEGFDDERHLWPAWFHLIDAYRRSFGHVPAIFGEQVASSDGLVWLDLVQSDMESIGYTLGPIDFPAAGVGAPHRRQRLYFVAGRMDNAAAKVLSLRPGEPLSRSEARGLDQRSSDARGLAIASTLGRRGRRDGDTSGYGGQIQTEGRGSVIDLDDAHGQRCEEQRHAVSDGPQQPRSELPGPTNGFWRDAEWIYCRDEKYRPIEPGTFPLVAGAPARVGRLRGYGNAINAEQAIAFIESSIETIDELF